VAVAAAKGDVMAGIWQALKYNPATGLFRWKKPNPWQPSGWFRGSKGCRNYRRLWWRGRHYMAHRVAWHLMTGEWPRKEIDHIDRDQSNNRWRNLREATRWQNAKNLPMRKNNKTGLRGASLCEGKYRATINYRGKKIHLGLFDTVAAASAAYETAKRRYHRGW
jgi:hypothetical protein